MKTNKVLLFIFLLTSPFALAEPEFDWEEIGGETEYHQTPKHVDKTPIKKQDQLDTIDKQSNSKSIPNDAWQEVEDANKQNESTRPIKTNDKNISVEREMQFDEIQTASQPEKTTARNKPKPKNKITLLPDNYLDNIAFSNEDVSNSNIDINQYENKLVEIPQESNIVTTTNETKYANVDLTYVYIYLACFLIALIASYAKYRNRKTVTTNTQKSI